MIHLTRMLFYLIVFILFWGTCFAQVPQDFLFHFVTNENQGNGLSQTSNHFVFKDSKGFVWISSMDGLNRYDGKNVKVYEEILGDSTSLFGQYVQGVFVEDEKSNLWFSTYRALHYYERKNDNFKHFYLKDEIGNPIPGFYNCGMDSNNHLWLIYQDSLFTFNTELNEFSSLHYLSPDIYRGEILKDTNGLVKNFYAYSPGKSDLLIIENPKSKSSKPKTYSIGNTDKISTLYPEKDSLIWIASNKGLLRFNPFQDKYERYDYYKNIKVEKLLGLAPYNDHVLAISTLENGLLFFNKSQLTFIKPKVSKLNSGSKIISRGPIHVLKDSSLWLSIEGKGLAYAYPHRIKFEKHLSSSYKDSLQFSFNTILDAGNGEIWASTFSNGIFIFNSSKENIGHVTKAIIPELISDLIIHMFKDDQNRIWILSWGGLCLYNIDNRKFYEINNEEVFSYGMQSKNGIIYLCSQSKEGIWQITDDFTLVKLDHYENAKFTFLYEDQEKNLYGCKDLTSLSKFTQNNNLIETLKIPIKGDFKAAYEPESNDSTIWFATTNGLIKLNKYNGYFKLLSRRDGLPSSTIYSILADLDGNLWISTNSGISCFNPKTNEFQNFGQLEGISALEFNTFSYLYSSENEIWFGSTDGITVFNPLEVNSSSPPEVEIIEILINDEIDQDLKCQQTGATNPEEIKKIILPYEKNTLSFSFSALELARPQTVRFQCKIDGIDERWINVRNDGIVRYSNIPHGKYILKIKGATSIDRWGAPRILKFNILPPFYKTWWFSFLFISFIIIGIKVFFQFQQRRKSKLRLALENQRNKFAQDMHDELGSSISSIKLSVEYLLVQVPDGEYKRKLEVLGKSTQNLYQKIREVIWAVNTRNDTLETLIVYLHRYGLEAFENSNINCSIIIPDLILSKVIPGLYRSNILYSYKEAINNILIHSEATHVSISFSVVQNIIKISIQDNGKGIPTQDLQSSSGNGLFNMRQRLKSINGYCNILSSSQGTDVHFSLKL